MKLYILFLILPFSLFADMKPGSRAFVFGDAVSLRGAPGTAYKRTAVLKIGTPVVIMGKTSIRLRINGFTSAWYHVRSKAGDGYVWGGLLVPFCCRGDFDGDGKKEECFIANRTWTPSYHAKREYPSHIEMRIIRCGRLLAKKKFFLKETYFKDISLFFSLLKGFDRRFAVIRMEYAYASATEGRRVAFFTVMRNEIRRVFTLTLGSGEGGYGFSEQLVLPGTEGGRRNYFIITKKIFYQDTLGGLKEKMGKTRYYFWNGNRFVEKEH